MRPAPRPSRGDATDALVLRAAATLAGRHDVTATVLARAAGKTYQTINGVVARLKVRGAWPYPFPVPAPRTAARLGAAGRFGSRGAMVRVPSPKVADPAVAAGRLHPAGDRRPEVDPSEARRACHRLLGAWRRHRRDGDATALLRACGMIGADYQRGGNFAAEAEDVA